MYYRTGYNAIYSINDIPSTGNLVYRYMEYAVYSYYAIAYNWYCTSYRRYGVAG